MIGGLPALILLRTLYLIQAAEAPQQISVTEVELGGSVTLQCPVSDLKSKFNWYKQSLGYLAQTVASVIIGKLYLNEPFKDSRFTTSEVDSQYFLTISNVSKEDEATYFCNSGGVFSQSFVNGIFLAVNDGNQQKCVNVKQSPETTSVQPGDPVTLQCSVLSGNKENTVQCPDEHSVYWFRTGSGESHPAIIHTYSHSSDEEEERSCTYSLSKTIRDSSDTGTYYCAVVACGEILFGEGTKVDTRCHSGSELDTVVFVLGVLLACCVTVNAALIFYINRRMVCEYEQYKGAVSGSHHLGHDKSTVDRSNDLDGETREVKYAALDFNGSKAKRRKKRQYMTECVYTVVRADYHNQHHLPL